MKKFLIICLSLVAIVTMFAITASAAEIVVPRYTMESVEASPDNQMAKNIECLFDGKRITSGIQWTDDPNRWWNSSTTEWYGLLNETLTITFKEEIEVTKIVPYVSGNWCHFGINAFDAEGNKVIDCRARAHGYFDAGVEVGPGEVVYPEGDEVYEFTPVKVKKIVITIQQYKSNPTTLKMSELEIYMNHDHEYNIDGGISLFPTCVDEGAHKYTCLCGHSITEPIPPTGEHVIEESIISFPNGYHNPGVLGDVCVYCGPMEVEKTFEPLLVPTGFSVCEFDLGIEQGFHLNKRGVQAYVQATGNECQFGIVIAASSALPYGSPLTLTDGKVTKSNNAVMLIDGSQTMLNFVTFKICGSSEGFKDSLFIVSGYIHDGSKLYYLSDGAMNLFASPKSYNMLIGDTNN